MSSAESGYAEINGTRLYYETAGAGHPLVLIHGYTLDSRMWDDQFDTLSQKYRVIRYDLRGFGKSACPSPGQKYCHTEDLKALLGYLKISKAYVLGLSMGGGIAVEFTLEHPEMAQALILVDSILGGFSYSDEFSAIFNELLTKFSEEGLGPGERFGWGANCLCQSSSYQRQRHSCRRWSLTIPVGTGRLTPMPCRASLLLPSNALGRSMFRSSLLWEGVTCRIY